MNRLHRMIEVLGCLIFGCSPSLLSMFMLYFLLLNVWSVTSLVPMCMALLLLSMGPILMSNGGRYGQI